MVFCYGYEKRLNWMLSSIKDCRAVSKYDIQVRVSTFDREDSRLQLTSQLVGDVFGEFVRVTGFDTQFNTRGSQRNWQVQNLDADTDCVLFADADHVYDPLFFDALIEAALEVEKISDNESNMYTVCRTSTDDIDKMDELISRFVYPSYIPNTIKMYTTDMETRITTAPGAGNTQFVFTKELKDEIYVNANQNRDRNFFRSITYKSDRTFRSKFDKVVKLEFPQKQYHLQHHRYEFDKLVQQ